MTLSYRTRRGLRNLGIGALIALLIGIVIWMIWIIWLDRFVVYTRDGAQLNFDQPPGQFSGEEALPPVPGETISIYYNDGENVVDLTNELTQMKGYYADTEALRESVALVREQIETLPSGTAIMLDMKNVLAEQDRVDTLIFDEVDTGVSGRAAQKVAEKLKSVAKNKQVLCVTHLPQIAAMGDTHLLIAKGEREGRTYTTVTPLDLAGRKQELARIIGGASITATTLKSAEEMLCVSV